MKTKIPIAVIGMAGLFPGALDLDTFWQNIVNKVDSASEVPRDRWIVDPDAMYRPDPMPDKAYSKRACMINGFKFNPEGIDLDANLLKTLDPLYQMVLQTGREALSTCADSSINKKNTGTVLASIALPTDASSSITRKILGPSFEEKIFGRSIRGDAESLSREECLTGRVTGLPGAILAEGLGLGGGSCTIDAACASSLYAVKLACDELQSFRADAMLAGGVSRPECLYTQVGFSQLRALSPSGRCAPFDKSADGLVVGEGIGILVLKRMDDALRDKDNITALIRGIGLSNDMRGNLLAPDSEGQVRAMRSAYADAGWSPNDIDLIECHGAGTPVGDAVELQSLRSLWGESGWANGQCAIGSVKSMVGHLLTGAGAAGMIKTILALKHKILPPSLNFKKAPPKSPLHNSPFRVQHKAEQWIRKSPNTPLRAAVSAFGFGGINSHLLLEEWNPATEKSRSKVQNIPSSAARQQSSNIRLQPSIEHPPIAIVGMASVFGLLTSLQEFQEAVLKAESTIIKRPKERWNGCDHIAGSLLEGRAEWGGFMKTLSLYVGELHLPPNEIPDILIQHLLMLKVSTGAMEDAGLPLRKERPHMGAVIGIDFDFEATDFHLRWNLHNSVQGWIKRDDVSLEPDSEEELLQWIESLRDSFRPPLTATRTLGALAGIIASRIAREFRLGGPSFIVSNEAASGLKALEIGVRSLQQNETEAVLVGAVDLFGDVRNVVTYNQTRPFTKNHNIYPFDRSADGTLPGEGAAALVIKRLDQAIKDGNRIYSVINGIGNATGGGIKNNTPSKDAYILSLNRSFQNAGVSPSSISYFETHGSGNPLEDQVESEALIEFFAQHKEPCAIGSLKPNIGYAGAASGLASLVKTSLCLYQEIIPPLKNFLTPKNKNWKNSKFHMPVSPQYWLRDRKDGPRRACIGSITTDGNCTHVILEGFEYDSYGQISEKVERERKRPLGRASTGLFIVEGNSKSELIDRLDGLGHYINNSLDRTDRSSLPEGKYRKRDPNIEDAACLWYRKNRLDPNKKCAVSIVADNFHQLEKSITDAQTAIASNMPNRMNGPGGISYSPSPLGMTGEVSFVFPGSGNHYVGMGRGIGVMWPEILRKMDAETSQLKTELVPNRFVPWRTSWEPGWEKTAHDNIVSDPLNMIFGQVVHGNVVANLIKTFGIKPAAVIGYSLGESAGLSAMGAWPGLDHILKRMLTTDLFATELAGPCNAARKAWNIPMDEDVNWCAAVINRPVDTVQNIISQWPLAKLLIVNTPNQCVIGGRKNHVDAVINNLGCEAIFLDGVVTVHCDAAVPAADAYKNLHIFPTTPPNGVRFYSCALGRSYALNSESAADSIVKQAVAGFNFTTLIEQAYQDGVRIFLEMGPHASCTGMINNILDKVPHLAVSACHRGEDDYLTILKCLGVLIAERVAVDLDGLYGNDSYPPFTSEIRKEKTGRKITLTVGGKTPTPPLLQKEIRSQESEIREQKTEVIEQKKEVRNQRSEIRNQYSDMMEALVQRTEATAEAHKTFLDFSKALTNNFEKTFAIQTHLLETVMSGREPTTKEQHLYQELSKMQRAVITPHSISPDEMDRTPAHSQKPVFNRDMCLEFAIGSVANVLGPEFAVVDTYKVRVRLPDEPLMLVDRIISLEGEKQSLGSGRIVTEHDVLPGAWYLDGGRAPVCISVEAGQADLFLCSYLGIDHAAKGERSYRLLDATVKFHRDLPCPGDVIRYEINIDHFVRQGDTYLFFFRFEGFIGDEPLISMFNGCAGFFTEEEVRTSGGIILTDEDTRRLTGKKPSDWKELVPLCTESYNDDSVEALRRGDLSTCFGSLFNGINLAESLWLPGHRMKLIDRILLLDPQGGRYGLGIIRAEADIHPDDWFLTCHFMDDMVMPGTLMYECCAHTLRIFIQRLGWISAKPEVRYEPVMGIESILKCRGPVTPDTKHVLYEIEIKEIGYSPEPYVIADALMFADGQRIVSFKDMGMRVAGVTRKEIEEMWKEKPKAENMEEKIGRHVPSVLKAPLFDRDQVLAFAIGKPSKAFGPAYQIFDEDRSIARLPSPPYSFMDRIVSAEPEAWILKPDGWIEAEYVVPPDAWYFSADRSNAMPFCVLLEIALQPCGWLAAYLGSALRSEQDLKFRNLGGNATLKHMIYPEKQTLTTRTRMTKVSEAAEMIIEHFDFKVLKDDEIVFSGETYFGFFTRQALARQVGIHDVDKYVYRLTKDELKQSHSYRFEDQAPFFPDDPEESPAPSLAMPTNALRMIDRIEAYLPDGGPEGLGFVRGVKTVNPNEWFFKAHFYQDPVWPGSLGIEAFLQLIKFAAMNRWEDLIDSHRFELNTSETHSWTYRGQVIPENKEVVVEAVITKIADTPIPTIYANGLLQVDGLYIYEMNHFGFKLIK